MEFIQGLPFHVEALSGMHMISRFTSIALLVVALVWVVQPQSSGATQDEPRRIVITAKRFAYEPNSITLKKDEPVELVLQSKDVVHGLRITELGVDLVVAKGGTATSKITPKDTGDFVGHCSAFCGEGHGEMSLTVHVVN